MIFEMTSSFSLKWYGASIFLVLETMIMDAKHKTMKFELLTLVACFPYIDGKKNTKENKKQNAMHKLLKIIDWVERSSLILSMQ